MNEKLLEQRAEEYISKNYSNLNCGIQGIIKQSCIEFATEETKLLSEHILELQKDKGKLIDENKKAKEIIHKVCYEFGIYDKDLMEKAKQFLGDEK